MSAATAHIKIASRLLNIGWQLILLSMLTIPVSASEERENGNDTPFSSQDKSSIRKLNVSCANVSRNQDVNLVHCKGKISNGYVAHYYNILEDGVVANELHADRVIIVDPGGPVLKEADVIDALESVSTTLDSNTIALSLVPPKLQPLSTICRKSTPASFELDCNVAAISELLVQEYSVALDKALEVMAIKQASIDLLAASYGSSRWSQLVEFGVAPKIETAVIVSPLPVGISGQDLEDAQVDFARWIFDQILGSECMNLNCLSEVELDDSLHCSDDPCEPEQKLRLTVSRLNDSEILEGLVGLAPFARENGLTLKLLLQDKDDKGLYEMLQHGRRQYLGMDPLGDMSSNEVYFLAGICPIVSENDLGHRYRFCESIVRTSLSKSEEMTYGKLSGEGSPEKTCVAVTYPDPMLGTAGMLGPTIGKHTERSIVYGKIRHGDLSYGAQIMKTIVASKKRDCPF